jgi:hypothetical protein
VALIRFLSPRNPSLELTGVPAVFVNGVADISEYDTDRVDRMVYLGAPYGVTRLPGTIDESTDEVLTAGEIAAQIDDPTSLIGAALAAAITGNGGSGGGGPHVHDDYATVGELTSEINRLESLVTASGSSLVFAYDDLNMARPNVPEGTKLLWIATGNPVNAHPALDAVHVVSAVTSGLAAPTGLDDSVSNGNVTLTVNTYSGADQYKWYRSGVSGAMGTTTVPSYTFAGVPGTTYTVWATVVDGGVESAATSPLTVIVPGNGGGTITAPTGLASTVTERQVTLSWNPVVGAESYRVYEAATTTGPVATVATTSRTSGALALGSYTYQVSAVVGGVEGPKSATHAVTVPDTDTGTPAAGAPTGLAITVSSTRVLTFTWNAVSGATQYRIWESSFPDPFAVTTGTAHVTPNPVSIGNHTYTVSAVVNGVETARSLPVTVIVESTGTPGGGGTGASTLPAFPQLSNPVRLTISPGQQAPVLDNTKDYIITQTQEVQWVHLRGGRRVVWLGGQIAMDGVNAPNNGTRPLYLQDQVEYCHVEGLWMRGTTVTGPKDGILNAGGGYRISLINCKVDQVNGTNSGAHADIIQNWGLNGERGGELYVERVDGKTTYQGIFFAPHQYGPSKGSKLTVKNSIFRRAVGAPRNTLIYPAEPTGSFVAEFNGRIAPYSVTTENVQFVQPLGGTAEFYSGGGHATGGQVPPPGIRVVTSDAAATPVLLGNPGLGYNLRTL